MPTPPIRLAEVLGGLTLAADYANDFPPEKVLRTAVLAVEIGRRAGLGEDVLRDAFYLVMFRYLGCTAFAHEEASIYGGGDDQSVRNTMAMADATNPLGTLGSIVLHVGGRAPARSRVRAVASLLLDREAATKHARAQCDAAMRLAELVGISPEIRAALPQVCERFDGKGEPAHIAGEALRIPVRLFHVADVAEVHHHRYGEDATIAEVERRAGKQLDPTFAAAFRADARSLLTLFGGTSIWETFLATEPPPMIHSQRESDIALAFAYFADLKSVYTLGHSTGVAELGSRAAELAGLPEDVRQSLRNAALLHDLGRVSVPNAIWDKPGPLGIAEWERVRLHAYYTERIVGRAPAWHGAARLASAAHERLDGGGYHRGVPQALLARPERILAAADVYCALREPRPHRSARGFDGAKDLLGTAAKTGQLDRDAVDVVLEAAGGAPCRASRPRGLSEREIEVLRFVARGKSNREIGTLLSISPRTVQNHVAHIYDKIGVYSRAGAALFAIEERLLDGKA
jgi:HD-GYP domain-containing protein (c-di-GMP phosphodiesterase class II)